MWNTTNETFEFVDSRAQRLNSRSFLFGDGKFYRKKRVADILIYIYIYIYRRIITSEAIFGLAPPPIYGFEP